MARVDAVRDILLQLGVEGEIFNVMYDSSRNLLTVPVTRPGREATVKIWPAEQRAEVSWARPSILQAATWLHKMPGPHLVAIRGNWPLTRVWRWLTDASVYMLLFLSASGVYLWTVLRAERKAGLALLGLGMLSFAGLIYAMV